MNLLLIDEKPAIVNILIGRYMPQGISVYHVKSIEQAQEAMNKIDMNFIIIDMDIDFKKAFAFLTFLKKLPSKPVRIIYSSITDKNQIVNCVEAGIAAYIIKPFTPQNGMDRVDQIINSYTSSEKKREFYRVTLNDNEDKTIFFNFTKLPKVLKGEIINISSGGIAFQSTDELPIDKQTKKGLIAIGDYVSKMIITLNSAKIELSGDIVFLSNNVFGIKFKNCSEENMFSLSKFIFTKVSKTL